VNTYHACKRQAKRSPLITPGLKVACSQCNLRELCLPFGLDDHDMARLDSLIGGGRKVKRGQHLYRAGDAFESIFAVRSGFFKTDVLTEDGRDQVTGFQMAGEILGMDGISTEHHTCNAVALEDSEVCLIPFTELELLSSEIHSLQHHLHKVMSREIVRDHGVMMLLGTMRAEERLAAFLLNLSQRFHRPRLFPFGVPPAHDARGDRLLPRPQARNRQPRLLPLPGRRPDLGAAKAYPHLDMPRLKSLLAPPDGRIG
jgi:CRP-like cAMP-binding protein